MSTLRWNGRELEVEAPPTATLLDVLRDELGDTTPKPGCREGRCGACTVLLDGEPVLSCLVPLGRALDGEVTTLGGGAAGDPTSADLADVQQAFARAGAVQCGICTPGMILAVHALLSETPEATDQQVLEGLVNNLCRCTGYQKIREAVGTLTRRSEAVRG